MKVSLKPLPIAGSDNAEIKNDTWTEYRRKRALNASLLWSAQRSGLAYAQALTAQGKPTPAMELGTAIHCAVLEPDVFAALYVSTDARRGTKARKQIEDDNAGCKIIGTSDYSAISRVAHAVASDPVASSVLSGISAEVSVYWQRSGSVPMKGRVDGLLRGSHVVDLKTTRDASPEEFIKSSARLGYHMRAAHYLEGIEQATGERLPFFVVAVETAPPYDVVVFEYPEDVLEAGLIMRDKLLERVRSYHERGEVFGCGNGEIVQAWLPSWAEPDWSGLELTNNGERVAL